MRPSARARLHALHAQRSIPLRGQALADYNARKRANRKPPPHILAAQAAAVAKWGAEATHAPDRMQRKEDSND